MKKKNISQPMLSLAILLVGSVAQAEMGTLDSNQRQYSPHTCELNGTDAVCTFAVINRGPAATLPAWNGYSDLIGIQFIDNAKVPHAPSSGYFLDKFGARQPTFVLQNGEQGWFVYEFSNVDARVTSGSFQFRNRVIGEVAVTPYVPPAVTGAPPARAANAAPAVAAPPPVAAPQAALAPAPVGAPPTQAPAPTASAPVPNCPPNDKACQAADKMSKVQSTTENTAKAAESTAKTVDTLHGIFKSFGFGSKSEPAAQPAQAQQVPAQ